MGIGIRAITFRRVPQLIFRVIIPRIILHVHTALIRARRIPIQRKHTPSLASRSGSNRIEWRISPRRCDRPPVTKRYYARQEMHYRSSPEPPEHSLLLLHLFLPAPSTHCHHPPVHQHDSWRRITLIWLDGPRKSSNQLTHSIHLFAWNTWQRKGAFSQVHFIFSPFTFDTAAVARERGQQKTSTFLFRRNKNFLSLRYYSRS